MKKHLLYYCVIAMFLIACNKQKQVSTEDVIKTYCTFGVRDDGTILKDGQPFFPVGFYIDRSTTSDYLTQIKRMTEEANFNVVNLPYNRDADNWPSFLDLCADRGVYVVSQMYYDDQFLGQVFRYKHHSAMYGWSVADDADNGHFDLNQLQSRHEQTKKADPNHVTEISLTGYYKTRRDAVDEYMQIADVSCYQCYPITPLPDFGVPPDNALSEAHRRIEHYVKSAEKFGRPLVLNSQTFSWTDSDPELDARFPSAAEIRNMVYGGLAAGIKGIISYTFNDLVEQPDQWKEFKAIHNEIAAMQAALLDGKLTRIETGDEVLVVSHWSHESGDLIIALNTSYTERRNVALAVPDGKHGTWQPVAPRLGSNLSIEDGHLSGQIQPTAVQAFKQDL